MMSDNNGIQGFKIKIFLDTNILCYLVDKTYNTLQRFIEKLSQIPIVDIVSSEYVLLEFIGVRKQENYFQEALKKAKSNGKTISISSFLKYNKRYDIPNFPYDELKQVITENITKEESIIINDYKITFSCSLNKNLLKPTRDICLLSKISKEDSLVLCSAIYESDASVNEKIILLTNDKDFHTWYNDSSQEISSTLASIVKEKPKLEHIGKIHWNGGGDISLKNEISSEQIEQFTINYIKNLFIEYYHSYYIGSTCSCPPTVPERCIGIKVAQECDNQIYVIIIGKELDFIYCAPHKIDMYHRNKSVGEKFVPHEGNNEVSFLLNEDNSEILLKLQAEKNLIFRHPDN